MLDLSSATRLQFYSARDNTAPRSAEEIRACIVAENGPRAGSNTWRTCAPPLNGQLFDLESWYQPRASADQPTRASGGASPRSRSLLIANRMCLARIPTCAPSVRPIVELSSSRYEIEQTESFANRPGNLSSHILQCKTHVGQEVRGGSRCDRSPAAASDVS